MTGWSFGCDRQQHAHVFASFLQIRLPAKEVAGRAFPSSKGKSRAPFMFMILMLGGAAVSGFALVAMADGERGARCRAPCRRRCRRGSRRSPSPGSTRRQSQQRRGRLKSKQVMKRLGLEVCGPRGRRRALQRRRRSSTRRLSPPVSHGPCRPAPPTRPLRPPRRLREDRRAPSRCARRCRWAPRVTEVEGCSYARAESDTAPGGAPARDRRVAEQERRSGEAH